MPALPLLPGTAKLHTHLIQLDHSINEFDRLESPLRHLTPSLNVAAAFRRTQVIDINRHSG